MGSCFAWMAQELSHSQRSCTAPLVFFMAGGTKLTQQTKLQFEVPEGSTLSLSQLCSPGSWGRWNGRDRDGVTGAGDHSWRSQLEITALLLGLLPFWLQPVMDTLLRAPVTLAWALWFSHKLHC